MIYIWQRAEGGVQKGQLRSFISGMAWSTSDCVSLPRPLNKCLCVLYGSEMKMLEATTELLQ